MKHIAFAVFFLAVSSAAVAETTQRYIVGMKADATGTVRAAKRAVFADRVTEEFQYLDSFVANLTDSEVQTLRNDPTVRYVESADIKFFALDAPEGAKQIAPMSHPANAQVTPYGITMVRAPNLWPIAKGDGINVAIVDTGIDNGDVDAVPFCNRPEVGSAHHGDAVRRYLRIRGMRHRRDLFRPLRRVQRKEFDVRTFHIAHRGIVPQRLHLGVRQIRDEGVEILELLGDAICEYGSFRRADGTGRIRLHPYDVTLRRFRDCSR